ncbi:hypothetical protein NDU88_003047 [Pleurodeles waltl]|uniref:Uncharacterized protein n=1 Tax=Pleurodeles waltl TaxID=8319 RepID=A0AAV7NFH4_PLEWA|nr:hypothetical protein NDU88_003047 [Pleurodeles waltl]
MTSPHRPAAPLTSPHTQPVIGPNVSMARMGSALVLDGSRLDRSVSPSSPGLRLSVLKPMSSTSANSMSRTSPLPAGKPPGGLSIAIGPGRRQAQLPGPPQPCRSGAPSAGQARRGEADRPDRRMRDTRLRQPRSPTPRGIEGDEGLLVPQHLSWHSTPPCQRVAQSDPPRK